MKRSVSVIVSLVMMLVLLFCLVSCGGGGGASESEPIVKNFTVGNFGYDTLQEAVDSITLIKTKSIEPTIVMNRNVTGIGAEVPTEYSGNIAFNFNGYTYTVANVGEETAEGLVLSGSGRYTILNGAVTTESKEEGFALIKVAGPNTSLKLDGKAQIVVPETIKALEILNSAKAEFSFSYTGKVSGALKMENTTTLTVEGGSLEIKDFEIVDESGTTLESTTEKMVSFSENADISAKGVTLELFKTVLDESSFEYADKIDEIIDAVNTGMIRGKVRFSNTEDHSGIIVSIEKTNGLVTKHVDNMSKGIEEKAILTYAVTDNDGSYEFDELEPGTYTIYASCDSSSEKAAVLKNMEVQAGKAVNADLMYLTATGNISGKVLIDGTENGNLGVFVFVAGTSYMAITDDAGSYVISDIPAGSGYTLVVMKGNYTNVISADVTVSAGETAEIADETFSSASIYTGLNSIVWQGSLDEAPSNPGIYWAYYNTKDGCSYIYNGKNWDLLAKAGQDGSSITWLGSFETAPSNPLKLSAYYNITDGSSYIYDGNTWTLLAKAGENGHAGVDGTSINWLGAKYDSSSITNPSYLDAFYSTKDGSSYIYNGKEWTLLAKAGSDGTSIEFLGSSSTTPEEPEYLNVYYNTTDGSSYIYDGTTWTLLAMKGSDGDDGQAGAAGTDGKSIIWKGSLDKAPANPEELWAYYNTTDGSSYIYDGKEWNLLAKAGSDGSSIIWLGERDSVPENPEKLYAYYNTQTGSSYIFDGENWTHLAKAGKDGEKGIAGNSIIWKGELSEAPEDPQYFWAYFNTSDGSSYIWNGTGWNYLAKGYSQHVHTYSSVWSHDDNYHWHEATCGHDLFRGNYEEHHWNKGVVVKAATCTENGEIRYTCTECGYTKSVETDKGGHAYILATKVDPTCTEDGYLIYRCNLCGDEKKSTLLALGHEFGTDHTCDRCGYTIEDTHVHSFTEQVVDPTCTEMGYTIHQCSDCEYSYKDNFIEPTGHKWDEGTVTKEKTCTEDGVLTYHCHDCDETMTEIIPKGHEYHYTILIPATCTETGLRAAKCEICGDTIDSEVIPASHTWDEGEVIKEASCTSEGLIKYTCTVCGETKEEVVPKTGHQYVNGTCTECGHNFIDDIYGDEDFPEHGMYFHIDDIVSAYGPNTINTYGVLLDHNEDADIEKVAVYLTQDGTMWRRSLAFTGSNVKSAYYVPFLSYDSDIYYTGMNSSMINTFPLSKNSSGIYTYGNYVTIGVNLADKYGKLLLSLYDVGQAGAKTKVFDDLDEMIKWLNDGECTHIYGEWSIIKEPTCTEPGIKQRTCTSCGDVQQELIAATGHTFSNDWTSNSTHHWHDASCGHDVVSDKAEHTFGDWVVRTEATAQAEGLDYRTCSVCGYEETRSIPRKSAVDIEDDIAKNPKIVLTSSHSTVQPEKSVSISANVDNITGFEYQWVVGNDIDFTAFRTSTDGTVANFSNSFNSEGSYDISLYIRKDGLIWSESIEITVSTASISINTVGGIGPSGGYIFYDCDADNETGNADGLKSSECGWRYLEAAPSDLRIVNGTPSVDSTFSGYSSGTKYIYYGYYRTSADGDELYVNGTTTYNSSNCTGTAVGAGKNNTSMLVSRMGDEAYKNYHNNSSNYSSNTEKISDYAARLCDILEYTKDGVKYDDWFLPSRDELNLMYTSLHKQGLGVFVGSWYWSSSENDGYTIYAWKQNFHNGDQGRYYRDDDIRVRPARAF